MVLLALITLLVGVKKEQIIEVMAYCTVFFVFEFIKVNRACFLTLLYCAGF